MQVGVIGGVCFLACLLSVGLSTGELDDPKQSEDSKTSDQKEVEPKNVAKGSKETNSDLKSDTNITLRQLEEGSKSIQNVPQNIADSTTSSVSNQKLSEKLSQPKAPSSPEIVTSKSDAYFMDSLFNTEQGSSLGEQEPPGDNGAEINTYFSNIPYVHHGFTGGSGSPSSSALFSPAISSPRSDTNPENVGGNNESVLRSTSSNQVESKLLNDNTITPMKSAGRSLTLNTNKAFHKITPESSTQSLHGTIFSPLFSSEYAHRPSSEFIEPLYQSKEYKPQYSYDSKVSYDETRRDSKKDDIQVRHVDASQYSEARNSYPYTPLSSGLYSSSKESEELRSGAPYAPSYPPYQSSGPGSQAYAAAQIQNIDNFGALQGLHPYSYGYPLGLVAGPESQSASAFAQFLSNGPGSAQSLAGVIDDAKSRVIMPHEYIFPHKMLGGENIIQCTRENELHHFWSRAFDCLICICVNEYGLLEPVCASCSGCRKPASPEPNIQPVPPTPEPYVPLPIPDSYIPLPVPSIPLTPTVSAPSLIIEPSIEFETTTPFIKEAPVGCNPLPNGEPFQHPLNPCQMCICKESINTYGKPEVRIECQDSSQCILPSDTTTLPPLPESPVPAPLPLCEKFPQHVPFPHPKEKCKQCKCMIEPSEAGVLEQQIICFDDNTDTNCVRLPKTELVTPPAPPIPIPVEPYPGPYPSPVVEPIPEHFPPLSVTPPPFSNTVTPREPLPWPPISTPPPPPTPLLPKKGPLPGPSPHESCRPYPPNQAFQHPWDDCQVCECSESKAVGMVNVEVSCYTKLSCCIESPEQVITAVAGKSNPSASGGNDGENSQALAIVNEAQTSTFRPYTLGIGQNQGYSGPGAIRQSLTNKPVYQFPTPYQSVNGMSSVGSPNLFESLAEYKPQVSSIPASPQNQGYDEANAVAQSLNKPTYLIPESYQTVNAYGSVINDGSQPTTEANAVYNMIPSGDNNLLSSFSPYMTGISQSQAYADVQIPSNGPPYQGPDSYQAQAISSVNGGLSSETSDEYLPLTVTYKPLVYPQYNPGISPSQTYAELNTQYSRPVSSTYKPLALYSLHNSEVSPNQAYVEAIAQYNKLMANTQKPPSLYGQYNPAIPQNHVLSQANGQNSNFVTSTLKPPALYNPYNQNQEYAQSNGQYSNIVTSTPRPAALYTQYIPGASQNQIYSSPNAVYTGALENTPTEKSVPVYSLYNLGAAQNEAYTGANVQNSLASAGYYLPGQYQTAKATGIVNSGDQSSAIAEAVAQSQDYSYRQPGLQIGQTNAASNLLYPYQSNYYGYFNPKFATYPARSDKGLDGYKPYQIQYTGNYEFNGQADAISILPQSSYYPYSSGYSQQIPATNMYSALIPTQNSYDVLPLYRPGQHDASGQNAAQAYAITKLQTKSGYPEDSEDSK